jgi:hypothetical protein
MTKLVPAGAIVASLLGILGPGSVGAQLPGTCYVPLTGTVYRVGSPDTPAACRDGHPALPAGGSLTFPFTAALVAAGPMFQISNGGAGAAGEFRNSSSGVGLSVWNSGTGDGGQFRSTSSTTGRALGGWSQGQWHTAAFHNTGAGGALWAGGAGAGTVMEVENSGTGSVAHFTSTSTTTGRAVGGWSQGQWHTAAFHNTGAGGALWLQSNGVATTLDVLQSGSGVAASVRVENPAHESQALHVSSNGGNGLHVVHTGIGGTGAIVHKEGTGNGLNLLQLGTGAGGSFRINNPGSSAPALAASTDGTGHGLFVTHDGSDGIGVLVNKTNAGPGIAAIQNGSGDAGLFFIDSPSNGRIAVHARTEGTGTAVAATAAGPGSTGILATGPADGWAGIFRGRVQTGALTAASLQVTAGGSFGINNPGSSAPALSASTNGTGNGLLVTHAGSSGWGVLVNKTNNGHGIGSMQGGNGDAGVFFISSPSNFGTAVHAVTTGGGTAVRANATGPGSTGILANGPANGWAGVFEGRVQTGALTAASLQVTGSKNAVVATKSGARLLHAEESTEVWFTDHGFGRLDNGFARISIDPIFAETVSLDEPYHVFVQVYGIAEVHVTNRSAAGFEVRAHAGDPAVEFSYRIMAKRMGFESNRLDRAPDADAIVGRPRG